MPPDPRQPGLATTSEETLQVRVQPAEAGPVLIYLPGLHGDWTLAGAFRRALEGRATFIEIVYPRTLTWSLPEYGREVTAGLRDRGWTGGWLLAESFGSQVAWAMLAEPESAWTTQGVIFAGGFVRYSPRWVARLAGRAFDRIPVRSLQGLLRFYVPLARWIRSRSPGPPGDWDEFIRRRTELDKQAAAHRLRLIAASDWRGVAAQTRLPVFHLTGLIDPVVPWWPVHRWLRRHCPGFRTGRIIARSDHNVLGSAPREAADQILAWIRSESAPVSPAETHRESGAVRDADASAIRRARQKGRAPLTSGCMATVLPARKPPAYGSGAGHVPPLENGAHLSAREFLRRYETMPELKKAELINGTVYMASPVRLDQHGEPDNLIQTWLGTYGLATPGVKAATNATARLGPDDVPQPDGLLRLLPEYGGQARLDPKGYLLGAPELVSEVSASTASLDARDKLTAYRRAGVREYLVWRTEDGALDWWVLEEDEYRPLEPGADGVWRSRAFPGLWMDATALLAGDGARFMAVLREGIQSAEHAAFAAGLEAQARSGAPIPPAA